MLDCRVIKKLFESQPAVSVYMIAEGPGARGGDGGTTVSRWEGGTGEVVGGEEVPGGGRTRMRGGGTLGGGGGAKLSSHHSIPPRYCGGGSTTTT
ncbi:hypothetical protein E2C01_081956 [Portunus trituberculatus]|uniref:Uncharacterized protein n=1 Tax=Portunus trituberculatus TaxID=210409 RepID=A0A5B7IX82_PORTR|nr:hypothetical protein [Portunus trituberculatus]